MPTKRLTEIDLQKFECSIDRGQAFLWDTEVKGLGVRTTPRGSKVFVFQSRIGKKSVRKTIGRTDDLSIAEARVQAYEIRLQFERESEAKLLLRAVVGTGDGDADKNAGPTETIGRLWAQYVEHGGPTRADRRRRGGFSKSYVADLKWMASSGGEQKKRGAGQLRPGPLNPLMALTIGDLDEFALRDWFLDQCKRSHAQATRSLVMLRGFLRWCLVKPDLNAAAVKAIKASKSRELSAAFQARRSLTSAISPENLPAWWAAVLRLPDPKVSVYLRALVMTGLHSRAMLSFRWEDIRPWWGADAYFSCHLYYRRNVPLTGEFVKLIESLPRDSEYVFSKGDQPDRLLEPRYAFQKTLREVGLPHMPLSALRRTFIKIAEIAGVPSGAVGRYSFGDNYQRHRRFPWIKHSQLRSHVSDVESTLKQILGVRSLALGGLGPRNGVSPQP